LSEQDKTREPQYELVFRVKEKHGISRLGLMVNESWNQDPRRTLFTMARYKFVSKMLEGRQRVLEVGCADAFCTRLVQQTVGPVPGSYDAVYALDVLEHIAPDQEDLFLRNSIAPLETHGVGIFGMPSLESQAHASPQSKAGHVNCKTAPDFKNVMERHFHSVFMFSMNDETVHTGYHKMAHYLIAVAAHRKS
jgi:hypothetical protein